MWRPGYAIAFRKMAKIRAAKASAKDMEMTIWKWWNARGEKRNEVAEYFIHVYGARIKYSPRKRK